MKPSRLFSVRAKQHDKLDYLTVVRKQFIRTILNPKPIGCKAINSNTEKPTCVEISFVSFYLIQDTSAGCYRYRFDNYQRGSAEWSGLRAMSTDPGFLMNDFYRRKLMGQRWLVLYMTAVLHRNT